MKNYEGNPISEVLRSRGLSVIQFSLVADVDQTVVYQCLEGRYPRLPGCVRRGLQALGSDTDKVEQQYSVYRLSLRRHLLDSLNIKDATYDRQ